MGSLREVVAVGLGGLLGTVARYLVGGWVHRAVPFATFPWGTLAVNVAGCFLIGFLGALAEARQAFGAETRLFLQVGILGGFTTFSSFAYETMALARDADWSRAALNIAAQAVLGLGAAWLGHGLVRT